MKTFVLLGIDKYHRDRVICLVRAETLAAAAHKLGGEVRDGGIVAEGTPRQLHVDKGQECGTFLPGDCTYEVLAKAAAGGDAGASERLMAYYRYGTDNIYREYVLGTAPTVA